MREFRVLLFLLACLCAAVPAYAQIENERAFLLVAKPGMLDPNFDRTVVLAIRTDDTGPIGVILNRPSTVTLNALFPDKKEFSRRNDRVYFGGPVEPDALLFAFRAAHKPAKGLFVDDDIYISGFSEVLAEVIGHPENAAKQRFFTGFASWAPGQLEDEIARGGWYVLRFDARALFEMNPRTLYEELYRRATVPRIETRGKPRGEPLFALARAG
ncbi:MAG TPA: YqgE/AlgH family protein [Burkholderiales bacterium]|nr:YqgE/AlgH family protein [Burkholderiales bacterium]